MSSRAVKWILFVAVPVLIGLYALYPPVPVAVQRERVEKRTARTPEEAERHKVEVGQQYQVSSEVEWKRFLPFALGQRETITRLVERKPDGTIVEEKTTRVRGRIKLGLDLAGGTELLYQLRPQEGERPAGKLSESIEVLKRRIDPTNVKEYRIQAIEQDRILIQVPHATAAEVEQLKARLAKMGKLEFKLAVPQRSADPKFMELNQEAEQGRIPEGYVRMYTGGEPAKESFLVKKGPAEITGEYLNAGKLSSTVARNLRPAVAFQFNAIGAQRFARITETHVGWGLAIILDGVLKSAPVIQERISGAGEITGDFTQAQVNEMINILRAGSLPMDVELAQETTVGPQLGRDSIHQSMVALLVAAALVFAFMGIYYKWCGAVANGALVMNMLLLLGALSVLGAALTLPGVAGIALTIGMAVDANILIFERIREESAQGKGLRLALRTGHDRAFIVIFDAQVTTILTAVILYLVGAGPVRGFAVTLAVGLILSLFTAVIVARLALETLVESGRLTEFRMLSVIKQPKLRFCALRRYMYVASLAVLVVGVVAFIARGSALFDIDFTGGTLVQISLAKPMPVSEVRSRVVSGGFPDAEVQGVGTAAATAVGPTDFGIRIRGTGVDIGAVQASVLERLTGAGLFTEGDALKATGDGRALSLQLGKPVAEMDLRKALGAGGDPYAVSGIDTIVTPETVRARQVLVHLRRAPGSGQERQTWGKVLGALGWAGLEKSNYVIAKSELRPEAAGAPAELALSLDKPLAAALLETELDKLQFPQLRAAPTGTSGMDFVLTGDRQALEQFARELPGGTELRGVPVAGIEGHEVTATLSEPFSEQDLRALMEQRGVTDVVIAPLDVGSDAYRLNLSFAPVRDKMQAIFADLSRRGAAVTFEPVTAGAEPPDAGRTVVNMKLSEPMSFADLQHYLSTADLGPDGAQIVVGEADYSPDMIVSDVTLRLPTPKAAEMETKIEQAFGLTGPVQRIATIGPTVAQELQGRAVLAVVLASVVIIFYMALRFHAFRFGVAAVIALVHDVLVTAGLIAIADWSGVMGNVKIGLASLAAFLTILGYSVNDTIVVFDRIRENMATQGKKLVSAELIDDSVNQTLSRTLLTGLTTLFVLVVMYLRAGPVLQGFALTLIIGVIAGTYSSVYIASPIVLDWAYLTKGTRFFFKALFFPVTLPFRLLAKKR